MTGITYTYCACTSTYIYVFGADVGLKQGRREKKTPQLDVSSPGRGKKGKKIPNDATAEERGEIVSHKTHTRVLDRNRGIKTLANVGEFHCTRRRAF